MWKRKALKKKVRSSIRQSYWRMAAVCFIIAVLTTAYPISTTFINLQTAPGPRLWRGEKGEGKQGMVRAI